MGERKGMRKEEKEGRRDLCRMKETNEVDMSGGEKSTKGRDDAHKSQALTERDWEGTGEGRLSVRQANIPHTGGMCLVRGQC